MFFRKRLKRSKKSRIKKLFLLFILILLLIYFGVWPVVQINKQGRRGLTQAKAVKAAFKENDLDKTKREITKMQAEFTGLEREAQKIYWARFIPFAGWHVGDFKNAMEAGDNLIKAGLVAIETIEPYADLIGFKKGEASFAEKSADDRIQTAVLTLDKVAVKVDDIAV